MPPQRKRKSVSKGKGRKRVLNWHPYLNAYAERKWLVFATDKDIEAAIDLLWADPLRDLPHGTPDGCSLIVPTEAVPFFQRAKLKFEVRDARTIDALALGAKDPP